jgi:hypothetical protein
VVCGRDRYTQKCRRRSCLSYVDTWLGDTRTRLWENLLTFGGDVVLTTITAPSLPWSGECEALGPHKHSGGLGCRVQPAVAERFNVEADRHHSRLHKAAAQRSYRRFGRYPMRLAYGSELQARGVIHCHVVLAWDSPLNRKLSRYYVRQLHELAPEYGYGFVDRKLSGRPATRAAGYVAKYLTKTKGAGLRELVLHERAPRRAVYVHRRLTAQTRCTMRNLRTRRFLWVKLRARVSCREVETLWSVFRMFDPEVLHPDDVEASADPAAVP